MDTEQCFKLNNEYRDVRLATDKKLKEIQKFISLTQACSTSDRSELKLPPSVDDVKKLLSDFDEYNSRKKYAFIRGLDGKYLGSNDGQRPMDRIERPVPLGWEVFSIEELKDTGKVALKSCGKYVSSENGERVMICKRKSVGEWEKFNLIQDGDIYAFKGNNGKFVSCSADTNNLSCSSDTLGNDEKFEIEWISDFADEINISWKHYDAYFKKLYHDYDMAIEGKKNMDLENYYIMSEIEVYHDGDNPSFSHHLQKTFDQKEFKENVQKFDENINNVKWIIRDQCAFLNGILWREKSDLNKVTKMLNMLAPDIAVLDSKSICTKKKSFNCKLQ